MEVAQQSLKLFFEVLDGLVDVFLNEAQHFHEFVGVVEVSAAQQIDGLDVVLNLFMTGLATFQIHGDLGHHIFRECLGNRLEVVNKVRFKFCSHFLQDL